MAKGINAVASTTRLPLPSLQTGCRSSTGFGKFKRRLQVKNFPMLLANCKLFYCLYLIVETEYPTPQSINPIKVSNYRLQWKMTVTLGESCGALSQKYNIFLKPPLLHSPIKASVKMSDWQSCDIVLKTIFFISNRNNLIVILCGALFEHSVNQTGWPHWQHPQPDTTPPLGKFFSPIKFQKLSCVVVIGEEEDSLNELVIYGGV